MSSFHPEAANNQFPLCSMNDACSEVITETCASFSCEVIQPISTLAVKQLLPGDQLLDSRTIPGNNSVKLRSAPIPAFFVTRPCDTYYFELHEYILLLKHISDAYHCPQRMLRNEVVQYQAGVAEENKDQHVPWQQNCGRGHPSLPVPSCQESHKLARSCSCQCLDSLQSAWMWDASALTPRPRFSLTRSISRTPGVSVLLVQTLLLLVAARKAYRKADCILLPLNSPQKLNRREDRQGQHNLILKQIAEIAEKEVNPVLLSGWFPLRCVNTNLFHHSHTSTPHSGWHCSYSTLRTCAISSAASRSCGEPQMNHPQGQQDCFVLIIFFLPLSFASTSGKGECKINEGARRNTFFLLPPSEECIFQGSLQKENDCSQMWSQKSKDRRQGPFKKGAERWLVRTSSAAGEISFDNQAGFPLCSCSRSCEETHL